MSIAKWRGNKANQRRFFDTLAHELGFHPITDPHQWYSVTLKDVLRRKVCSLAQLGDGLSYL